MSLDTRRHIVQLLALLPARTGNSYLLRDLLQRSGRLISRGKLEEELRLLAGDGLCALVKVKDGLTRVELTDEGHRAFMDELIERPATLPAPSDGPRPVPPKSTLESVIRGAVDEFINAKSGWDGDFEPVIVAVVAAVRSYFDHDFAKDVSKAVERELQRIMGAK
jgi:hypothetical protein